MSKPTIIPRDPALIAVAKNGEFIGYADQKQIDEHRLEIYVSGPKEPEAEVEAEAEIEPAGEGEAGAQPAAVRKAPGRPARDA